MKKICNKILLTIIVFIGIILISNTSKAGELRLKNLDYKVQLNSDGTADVTENWRIYIEDTNTLFKTFEIDSSKYKEIIDVKVREIKGSGSIDFRKINVEKYHVDKNCFYALKNSKGKFEIAWGAHAEDVTKTYEITYKIVDAVKNYTDCSEFYWQFVSTESEIPASKVTGTIILPNSVSNKEDLKTWAHGPLNGNIKIDSNKQVSFEAIDFRANTMLEARVVTPNHIFANNINKVNTNKLQSILDQEQKWADEANRKREEIRKRQEMMETGIKIFFIVSNIIGVLLAIVIIKKIIKYHKELKEHPVLKPEMKLDYFRDIPDEEATPADAGFLYYFKSTGLQYNISKIISATMLDLCLKGYLSFEEVAGKKDQIKVTLKQKQTTELPEDEKAIYILLQEVANNETKSFTMKDFEKYAKNHSSSVLRRINRIEEQAKKSQEEKKNYDKVSINTYHNWVAKGVGYLFLGIFSVIFMQVLAIPAFIAAIYSFKVGSRYNQLTQKRSKRKRRVDGTKEIYVRVFINERKRSTRVSIMGKIFSICYCFWN